jgi:hypothetical protein
VTTNETSNRHGDPGRSTGETMSASYNHAENRSENREARERRGGHAAAGHSGYTGAAAAWSVQT